MVCDEQVNGHGDCVDALLRFARAGRWRLVVRVAPVGSARRTELGSGTAIAGEINLRVGEARIQEILEVAGGGFEDLRV